MKTIEELRKFAEDGYFCEPNRGWMLGVLDHIDALAAKVEAKPELPEGWQYPSPTDRRRPDERHGLIPAQPTQAEPVSEGKRIAEELFTPCVNGGPRIRFNGTLIRYLRTYDESERNDVLSEIRETIEVRIDAAIADAAAKADRVIRLALQPERDAYDQYDNWLTRLKEAACEALAAKPPELAASSTEGVRDNADQGAAASWQCKKCGRWNDPAVFKCRSEYDTGIPCNGIKPPPAPGKSPAETWVEEQIDRDPDRDDSCCVFGWQVEQADVDLVRQDALAALAPLLAGEYRRGCVDQRAFDVRMAARQMGVPLSDVWLSDRPLVCDAKPEAAGVVK